MEENKSESDSKDFTEKLCSDYVSAAIAVKLEPVWMRGDERSELVTDGGIESGGTMVKEEPVDYGHLDRCIQIKVEPGETVDDEEKSELVTDGGIESGGTMVKEEPVYCGHVDRCIQIKVEPGETLDNDLHLETFSSTKSRTGEEEGSNNSTEEAPEKKRLKHQKKRGQKDFDFCDKDPNIVKSTTEQNIDRHMKKKLLDKFKRKQARLQCKTSKKKSGKKSKFSKPTDQYLEFKAHRCDICEKFFKSTTGLKIHKRKFHGWVDVKTKPENKDVSRKQECDRNPSGELEPNDGRFQLDRVVVNFKCDLCDKELKTARTLKGHKRRFHSIVITDDSRTNNSNSMLTGEPNLVKSLNKSWNCDICSQMWNTSKDLHVHKLKEHGWMKSLNYQCQFCNATFSKRKLLSTHEREHRQAFTFICKVCKGRWPTDESLQAHIKEKHGTETPFLCNICGKSFSQKYHLQEHIKTHQDARSFVCGVCDKGFTHRRSFMRHLENHEKHIKIDIDLKKENVVKCVYCNENFSNKEEWRKHMRTHPEHFKYKCKFCDAVFPHSGTMNRHMKEHLGRKTHTCRKCGKSFMRMSHLRIHERIHSGEKPFVCSVCCSSFARSDTLKTHVRNVHELGLGEKPIKSNRWGKEPTKTCRFEGCSEKFVHGAQRIRHEKKKHGEQWGKM